VTGKGGRRPNARRLAKDTGSDLASTLDYRWAIEPAIAELAAQRRTEDDIEGLRATIAHSDPASPEVFRAADARIHLALAHAARSPGLATSAAEIRLRLAALLAAMPALNESAFHSQRQHEQIIDAIAAGDGQAARAAMLEHVDATAELLRGLL
jgi:DNA-binding FadR family transcriptional regulator